MYLNCLNTSLFGMDLWDISDIYLYYFLMEFSVISFLKGQSLILNITE